MSGKNDLSNLGERLWDTTSLHQKDARTPTHDDVDLIVDILGGRLHPTKNPPPSPPTARITRSA